MTDKPIVIGGIAIPFSNSILLFIVGIHVLAGLTCVVSGIIAMFSKKGPGRHPAAGRVYFLSYSVVFVTTAILSLARWHEDYYLLIIGAFAFAAAVLGRTMAKKRGKGWQNLHIIGMGMSFVLLLAAFYLDNGKNLPVWKDLPHYMYWLLPNAVGIPLIFYSLMKYRNMPAGSGKTENPA